MELTLDAAAAEARTEFGSLELSDGDHGKVTLLSPIWLEDSEKLARIREHQQTLTSAQDSDDVTMLGEMRQTVIDLLGECADEPERWRKMAADKPFPVLLQVFRRWQDASQPGEA